MNTHSHFTSGVATGGWSVVSPPCAHRS
jgi:hypothetical protein